MRRYVTLLRKKRVVALYSLTLVAVVVGAYVVYLAGSKARERRPVNVSILGKMSELQDGSLVLFDVTDPVPGFGSSTPFEAINAIRIETPDIYIFEPNDPASLELSSPMVVDDNISSIPQYSLKAGEDSVVHLTASDRLRLDFTPQKDTCSWATPATSRTSWAWTNAS